ncbi:O-antigen ligase family protein [Candidatus Uhrbacteria bacterium]|nr:O-antigen ligase family protein [Candidatus Uhrbacteria bacterium]
MIPKFANTLLFLAVLFLPWQTQWIITTLSVSGEPSQFGVFGLYVVEVMIACAFLLRGRQRMDERVQPIARAVYLFLSIAFFSLTFSAVSIPGWSHLIHLVSAVMFFFVLVDERTDIRRILSVFLFGLLVPILFGWAQVVHGISPALTTLGMAAKDVMTPGVAVVETVTGRMLRAYGTFPHPNIFGGYMAFGILALAWLARFAQRPVERIGLILASSVLGATLIITFSRSAWLGIFIAFLLLIGLMLSQKKLPPHRAIPVMIVGLASILLTLVLFHAQVFSRFNPSVRIEAISIEERASQYQTFGEVFWTSPLLGVGPNGYTFTLASSDPDHPVWSYQPIHNTFLLILAELGVVGFVMLFYWMSQMDKLIDVSRKTPNGLFVVSAGVLFLVIGLFDHYLWSLWPGLALSALAFGVMVRWGSENKSA